MKRLNGMDAMLLYSETPNLHTHTAGTISTAGADHSEAAQPVRIGPTNIPS